MKLEELNKLIKKKERMKVEFKTTPLLISSEKNRFEIASQLVAFANRNGGFLIFGVKDDGSFEGAKIDEDKETRKISSIAKDKCSPPVVFTHQFIQTKKGDVLIIEIGRRKGIPHAVVERDDHEIKKRTYYIRTSKGKRLLEDKTLEWLFKNIGNPKLSRKFRFFVTYNRKTLGLPPLDSPISFWQFVHFFNSLSEDDKKYLLEDEFKRVGSFIVEIAPYVMLKYLAQFFYHSWQIEIFRTKERMKWHPKKRGIEGKTVDIADISRPSNSFISKLSFDLRKILETPMEKIVVPPDAKVKIQLTDLQKERLEKSLLRIYQKGAFSLEVSFSLSDWNVGLPLASPLRYKYQRVDIPFEERKRVEEEIASFCIDTAFNVEFKFPEVENPLFNEHFEYGKTILNQLEHDWNWDTFLSELPQGKLYAIEDKIDEILRKLKRLSRTDRTH